MKTKLDEPNDILLTRWMDGELDGKDLAHVDAWVAEHPELLAERNAVQAMTASLKENIPASEEPPYPDFFNHRILRTIEEERLTGIEPTKETPQKNTRNLWQWLSLPIAAAAMAVCFYWGAQTATPPTTQTATLAQNSQNTSTEDSSLHLASTVYTPDSHVQADIFESDKAHATVIVLTGLQDIPADMEITGETIRKNPNGVMVNTDHTNYTY